MPYGKFSLTDQQAFVGPNGSGKSTLIDAMNLVFGRQKLVRTLTEHDFTQSNPKIADRIRIVATLGGFGSNDPANFSQWFREGRGVPKWWDPATREALPTNNAESELCVQIGFSARFDYEDLEIKTRRYFHDDDEQIDPFDDENVVRFPERLLQEIGYFALPTRRTWAASISFASELFRKAVTTIGGIPSNAILEHVQALRNPDSPLELQPELKPLISGINRRLAQLIPESPELQLRITNTDVEGFLAALVPHYFTQGRGSLPAGRHGTGLISLQSLALLLEIGRERKSRGQSFILTLEEPELHISPGLQRRIIGDAASVSDQIITTTHSPRVAAFFEPSSTQILYRTNQANEEASDIEEEVTASRKEKLEGRVLIPETMIKSPNALIQLFTDARVQVIESLMQPSVLVPEGRIDFEWLRLLLDITETGRRISTNDQTKKSCERPATVPPYGAIVGVIPTRSSHVKATFERLASLHPSVSCLVDGDSAGKAYTEELVKCSIPPTCVIQWPNEQTIEDVIVWILDNNLHVLIDINKRLDTSFQTPIDLSSALKSSDGKNGGLKTHYYAHEEIAGALKSSETCVARATMVLETICRCVLGKTDDCDSIKIISESNSDTTKVYQFKL